MEIREALDRFIEEHAQEMVEDLRRLVRVPSTKGEAEAGAPFGPGPARALEEALALARERGLETRNCQGYVGLADLNQGPTRLGILAHLDVVPQGGNWTRPPFDLTREGGRLYGRGTADDKGPAVAALYAMLAVRAAAPELAGNARLILGTDEESGSADLAWYFAREPVPPFLFTPDADYPLINVEKGRLAPVAQGSWPREEGVSRVAELAGGERPNVVPRKAEALVAGLTPEQCAREAKRVAGETGVAFTLREEGEGTRIEARGTGAHAARPEQGNSALTALLALLSALPLGEGPQSAAIRALSRMFPHGDSGGQALGWACRDESSGPLTLNLGVLELGEEGFTAQLDARTPVTADQRRLLEILAQRLAPIGGRIREEGLVPPHAVPEDSPLVRTLLKIYEECTGRPGECLSTGGLTYVHNIPGGVAFGCAMPGVDNRMHGADEFVLLSDLVLSAKMFARAILELCGPAQ